MDLGLEGRTAIVAGGSRGIGRAIAKALAREGVDIALVSRSLPDLEAAAAEIAGESGRKVVALACDVAKRDDVDRAVERAVETLGGLHILVNSGSHPGGSPTAVGHIDTIVDDDLLHDFDVKYLGSLRLARAAIPHMRAAGWGRIINISGSNARIPGNLSGGARNTSLVHLTRTLAMQFGRDGITVNCIHPGTTRTESIARRLAERAAQEGITRRSSSGASMPRAPFRPRRTTRLRTPSAAWWNRRRSPTWPCRSHIQVDFLTFVCPSRRFSA